MIAQPLKFEPNVGQPVHGLESQAKFVARRSGYTVQLDRQGARLDVAASGGKSRQVRMDFAGANPSPGISGESKLPGIVSYFPASDTRTWRTAIPTYGRVAYKDVYPGVDLAFYGNEGRLEYDVALNAGAAADGIALALSGADHVELDKAGNLLLRVEGRDLRLLKPVAYQQTAEGARKPVEVAYRIQPADPKHDSAVFVRFDVGGSYDRNQALVIDPVLDFATWVDASTGLDWVTGVAVDGNGNIYVAGNDAQGFTVLKYNASGAERYNATFGSSVGTYVYGLAVDANGRAYVSGEAEAGLPTTSSAYQQTDPWSGGWAAFLSVLTANGSGLAYSTYLGGSGNYTWALGLALDSSANAYLYGRTYTSSFPTTAGAYLTSFPTTFYPWFVAKINPSLSGTASLVYSTLFWNTGAPSATVVEGITADASGNTYLTGTGSSLVTTSGAYSYPNPDGNGTGVFVSKLNAAGSALVYTAYLGPGSEVGDNGVPIAVDGSGTTYITGNVGVDDFPTTAGAYQTSYPGAFVTNLSADGSTLLYSTFLNGPSSAASYGNVVPTAIAITPGCSSACNAFVTGYTSASDFPLLNAIQTYTNPSGQNEAFAAELSGNGSSAVFSTYFGGATGYIYNPYGYFPTIATDAAGNTYLAGNDYGATDFPATVPPPAATYYGYLAKIGPATAGAAVAVPLSVNFGAQAVGTSSSLYSNNRTAELRNMGSAPVTISSITSNDPAEFTESDNCAGTIAAGGICTMTLAFTPNQSGVRNATLTIASSAPNSPSTVALAGTGTSEAFISVTPASLSFPDQAAGTTSAAQILTFTNIGNQATTSVSFYPPAGFIQVNNCPGVLPAGGSCTMSVQFAPTQIGLYTGSFQIGWGNTPYYWMYIPVTGTGTVSGVTGAVTLSDTALNFGTSRVGVPTSYQIVYLFNTGSSTVTLSAIAAATTTPGAGAKDFSIYSSSCSVPIQLNPQGYCYVYMQFTPSLASAEAGTLTFTDDASGSPQTVSLSGLGVASSQVLEFEPGNQVFLPQPVGFPSAAQTFYVLDQGTSPVTIAREQITGPFYVSYDGCSGTTLQPPPAPGIQGGYCYINVVFLPTATGTATGTLTLYDAATGNPQSYNLMGTGIAATGSITLDPGALTFAPQAQGTTSAWQYIYILNSGDSAVTINSYTTTGDYALASYGSCGTAPWVLAAGSSCYLYVDFTPTSTTNPRSGTLVVGSTAGNQTVTLTGTGETASLALGLTPTAMAFGTVKTGSTQYIWAWVRNTGTEPVTFTSFTLSGTGSADYGIANYWCPGTLAPGQNCSFYISFDPSATGSRPATLTVASTAPSVTMTITGTGATAAPTAQLAPNGLAFAQTPVGTVTTTTYVSGASPVTFYNNGTSSITLKPTTISSGSANFKLVTGQDTCSGQTVAASSSCSVQVQFNPTTAGYQTGTLTFTESNNATVNAALAGYAPAVQDAAVLDPTVLNTWAQVVGTNSSAYGPFYLTNTGNTTITVGTLTGVNTIVGTSNTGDFSTASGVGGSDACSGATLQVGQSCAVYVVFAPGTAGARTGSITFPVTYQDNTTASFTLTLAGTATAVQDSAALSPTILAFTDQAVGTHIGYEITQLTNTGNTPLTLGTLTGVNTIVGTSATGEFSTASGVGGSDGCSGTTLQPKGSCAVYVVFTPTATGAQSGSITFPVTYKDNTTASFTATLTGNGVAASTTVAVTPAGINFGNQVVNQGVYYTYTVTVTNTGNTPVSFGTSTVSSTQFPIQSDGCSKGTIQPRGSCSYTMGYAPTATGNLSGTLTIPDNAAGNPHTVALTGTGIAATSQIVLSQTSVSFGNQTVGVQSPAQVVYLTNQGATKVTISSIALGGTNPSDFSETSNCGGALGADASCAITIYFTPAVTGSRSATITETDSSATSQHKISLAGTGVAVTTTPAVTLYPTPLTFPSTGLASSAKGSFSFTAAPASEYSSPPGIEPGIEVGGQVWYFEASAGSNCTGLCVSSDYSSRYSASQVILIGDTLAHTVQNVVAALNNSGQAACGYTDPTSSDNGYQTCYHTTTAQTSVTAVAASPAVYLTATMGGVSGDCTGSTCYTGYGWSSYTTILGNGDPENISPAAGGLGGGIGAPQSFSVHNSSTGSGNLSITQVKSNSTAFPILNDGCTGQTLTPGQDCLVYVTFAPTAIGTNSSTISITDNAGTQSESVTGTGSGATTTTSVVSSLNPSTYGQSVSFTATVSGFSPTGTVRFTANGTTISGCSAVALSASPTATCTTTALPAGTSAIVATYSGDSNNQSSTSSPALNQVINKAPLTVTANNLGNTYGAPLPTLTYTMTGFENGDTQTSATTGSPSLSTTATSASTVGTYPITSAIGTLAAANYTFVFVNGTLTVGKATLTVTASNLSMTYGAAIPPLTFTMTGFLNGDTEESATTGAPSLSTTATTASPAGTYPITAAAGTLAAANYTFTFVNGTLSVTQATLLVTASNLSRTYGAANPSLTYTMTGFLNGDTQTSATTGAPALTTTAKTTSPVGTYPITVTKGTLAAANYTFTFVNGTLTVTSD
jgi:hypothetical protein